VNDIIQGRNIQSEIAYRETSGDLNRQQAANLRAQEPHIAAKMLAEIDTQRTAAAENRAQVRRIETLLPEEVRSTQALTRSREEETRRNNELLVYGKRKIDADIEQSMAAAGLSNTNADIARKLYPLQAKELENKNAEYVQMQIDGKQFTAKGMKLVEERNDNIQKMMELEKARQAKINDARKDAISMQKTSTETETQIKALSVGGHVRDSSKVYPLADLYHATSIKPYVYILEPDPGRQFWPPGVKEDPKTTEYRKITPHRLPNVDGHQYNAQEIYDKAALRSMSVQEYMERVFYPMLQKPVPWTVTAEPK
jgi:hypothetical protein